MADAAARERSGPWWPGALVGLALPLFIVTMAWENMTGMAVLHRRAA